MKPSDKVRIAVGREMMIQISAICVTSIALFWTCWHYFNGRVPVVSELMPYMTLYLPFTVSRWWDVLLGLVWPCLFVWNANKKIHPENAVFEEGIQNLIAISLLTGFVFGLYFGIAAGFCFTLAMLTISLIGAFLTKLVIAILF